MLSRRPLLISVLALVLLAASIVAPSVSALTASPATQGGQLALATKDGVVHLVLFWMEGCSHCELVKTQTLTPLKQKYGGKLDVIMIEVEDAQSADRLTRTAAAYGYQSGTFGVPFLVIGDKALMGSGEIPTQLPGLIEKHLAAGGVDVPSIPALADLAQGAGGVSAGSSSTGANGFAQAWIVMGLLAASVLFVLYAVGRYLRRRRAPQGPSWLGYVFAALCIIGMAVAFYMTYVETTKTVAVCGPVGDCNAVQNSAYAKLFGVLPVGVLGLLGYIAMLAAWAWGRLRDDALAAYAPAAIFAMALFGVIFTIYLTYLELFVIKAVCAWCLASAVVMALLLILSVGPALNSIAEE